MFRPRVIPVLLLKGKGLVKTIRFKKQDAKYIGDPINAVKIFNDLEADELVFLDITASLENRTIDTQLVKNIGDEAYMPFAVGGGISTIQQIRALLEAGAEKVVLNTAAINNPDIISSASKLFGNQSIIVSLDVKKNLFGKYRIYTHGGTKETKLQPFEFARQVAESGAGEIMVNSIDNDGIMDGYDIELIKKIADSVQIPVVACGGAANETDLVKVVKQGNASAAAAGSLFVFHGPRKAVLINYPERKKLLKLFN